MPKYCGAILLVTLLVRRGMEKMNYRPMVKCGTQPNGTETKAYNVRRGAAMNKTTSV